jgi:hypothetical protein
LHACNKLTTGATSCQPISHNSEKEPGNALANAMAFGTISRTSNGGTARVTVGPGQALVGGFAVAAPNKVQEAAKAALTSKDPSGVAGAV